MRRGLAGTFTLALLTLLLAAAAPSFAAYNDLGYDVEFTELTVYRDGLVHVAQTLSVNETFPSVTLTLLHSSVENMVVVDENDTALDYDITETNITVYSLGATAVALEYDTTALTYKEAEVWTLNLDAPYNLTVYLPEDATLLFISDMPASIETQDRKLVLTLWPNSWEISYVLPIASLPDFRVSNLSVTPPEVTPGEEVTILATASNVGGGAGSHTAVLRINGATEATETVTLEGGQSTTVSFQVTRNHPGSYNIELDGLTDTFTVREASLIPPEYAVLVVVLAVVCVGLVLLLRRRKPSAKKFLGAHPHLRQEDRDVIQFLEDNGGKAFESEIREKFPNMPRTSLWRLVRRLEKMEIVTVKRIGLQNQVELKK
jgi:uncharacterized membrane protein